MKKPSSDSLIRCGWAVKNSQARLYHDKEWGTPIYDHKKLFENLSLCTQQAGISWRVVWNKRLAYRKAFHDFDMESVSLMTTDDIEALASDTSSSGVDSVIRNRRKLLAIVNNAKICLDKHRSYPGGFSEFLWSFVPDGQPVVNKNVWSMDGHFANESVYSKQMAKRFKELGFAFLGSITLNAFMQQCGMLNDHCVTCYKNPYSKQYRLKMDS